MTSAIITALVGLFCTTVSSVVTFILTRKKYNTEVDSQRIENMSKSFELYKKTMEETLEAQKAAMNTTINSQNEKIATLQKENDILRTQLQQLQSQMINFPMGNNLADIKDKLMPLTDILKAD